MRRHSRNLLEMKKQDYREDLRAEFLRRARVRPQYSLRAFARDLNIAPSRLSEIFNLKSHLTLRTALRVSNHLNLSESEKQRWLIQVEMTASRSPSRRLAARKEFKESGRLSRVRKLKASEFSPLANWYMLLILELAAHEKLDDRATYWSKVIGISEYVYRQALEQLIQGGYVEVKNGRFKATTRSHHAGDTGPSANIREFHSQLLQQARDRLLRLAPEERDFNALYVSLTQKQFLELKNRIRTFLSEILEEGGRETHDTDVFALAIQLFPLTQTGEIK